MLTGDYKMKSGRTLWNELVSKYYQGADAVLKECRKHGIHLKIK